VFVEGQCRLEIAVTEYIDWFNHRRLDGELGLFRPAPSAFPRQSGAKLPGAPKESIRAPNELTNRSLASQVQPGTGTTSNTADSPANSTSVREAR